MSHNDVFEPPIGLVIWNPPGGDVVTIRNRNFRPVAEPPVASRQEQPSTRPSLPNAATAAAALPLEEEPEPNPSDPNDWSVFPKLAPDEKGNVLIKYNLKLGCDVSVQLINAQWREMARIEFPRQPVGEATKSLDVSRVPSGKYLLVVKGNGKLVRRYQLLIK